MVSSTLTEKHGSNLVHFIASFYSKMGTNINRMLVRCRDIAIGHPRPILRSGLGGSVQEGLRDRHDRGNKHTFHTHLLAQEEHIRRCRLRTAHIVARH